MGSDVRDNPVRAGLVRSAEGWPYAVKLPSCSTEKKKRAVIDRAFYVALLVNPEFLVCVVLFCSSKFPPTWARAKA